MTNKNRKKIWVMIISIIFIVLPAITGCSTIHQQRVEKIIKSGFIKDDNRMQEGKEGQARFVYIKDDHNWSKYDKIMIDPVHLVLTDDSDMAKVDPDERQQMADYLHFKLREELGSTVLELVSTPSPTTLRTRWALTDMNSSDVVFDTLTSVVPVGLAIDMMTFAVTGDHINVGKANIEVELLDSWTGEILCQAMDGQAGDKYTGKFDKWAKWKDTKDACDYWAMKSRVFIENLAETVDYDPEAQ
jgi:hypothetical protein